MATGLRRFTISITPMMKTSLDEAKREVYYKETQSDMIRDLIIRGLATLSQEQAEQPCKPPENCSA